MKVGENFIPALPLTNYLQQNLIKNLYLGEMKKGGGRKIVFGL